MLNVSLTGKGYFKLSAREIEIAELVSVGMNNLEIARHLGLSRSTIRFHLSNIFEKLGFAARTELAAFYARNEELFKMERALLPA